MPLFLDHLLAIPPSCNAYPCMIYLCYKGFLVGSMLDGVARKPRAYAEQSTHAYTTRHTLGLRLLIMIPCTTMSVWYLLMGIPHIYRSLFCLEISKPDLNLVSLSSEVTKGMILKELLMDENVRRLQEVVDQGPWLIWRDDHATCAITVGTRGHRKCKVGQVTSRTKFRKISCFLHFASWIFSKFSILICNGSYHQHRAYLVGLFPAVFDGWSAPFPLRVFRSESRDEILLRG